MGGAGILNWPDQGILPAQDFQAGVPIAGRMMMLACRVGKVSDPDSDKTADVPEWAVDNSNMSVVGDIHPWGFWQTAGRNGRPIGSFSQAWSGIVVGGVKGGWGAGTKTSTGTPPKPSIVLPHGDARYVPKAPGWSKCLPLNPRGMAVMVMPSSVDGFQYDYMLTADPRLIASHVEGPGECGTLVCDLQPEGVICSRGDAPGWGGRAARLQCATYRAPSVESRRAGTCGHSAASV